MISLKSCCSLEDVSEDVSMEDVSMEDVSMEDVSMEDVSMEVTSDSFFVLRFAMIIYPPAVQCHCQVLLQHLYHLSVL